MTRIEELSEMLDDAWARYKATTDDEERAQIHGELEEIQYEYDTLTMPSDQREWDDFAGFDFGGE